MKALVKRLVRQARVMSSDDPDFVYAPRGGFIETMWSDDERNELGLDRDDYLAALRQAWEHFHKPYNKPVIDKDTDMFSDEHNWRARKERSQ